jgi:hypothetical protein
MMMAQCLLVCECECECEWREEAKSNSKPDQPTFDGDDELMSMSTRLSSSDDPTGSGFSSPITAPGLLPRESHAAASCDGASATPGPSIGCSRPSDRSSCFQLSLSFDPNHAGDLDPDLDSDTAKNLGHYDQIRSSVSPCRMPLCLEIFKAKSRSKRIQIQ